MKRYLLIIIILLLSSNIIFSENFKKGDLKTFWQFDVVKSEPDFEKGYYQNQFVCISETEHSYVFIEKDLMKIDYKKNSLIEKMQNRFDEYFPLLTEYFGPPSDLDKNEKFIILVSDIRDWFYYNMEIQEGMEPILGYYWFPFNQMNKNDYLTMDYKQPEYDAYGTLMHEYFHNIFDNINPQPKNVSDRAVNEALAHYSIYLNKTMDKDEYCNWQFSILKKDLEQGKLLDPFDGTADYFDIKNEDTHHCYAAGYYFMYYIAEEVLKKEIYKKEFFNILIYEEINNSSFKKIYNALYRMGIIDNKKDYNTLYFSDFKNYLLQKFDII